MMRCCHCRDPRQRTLVEYVLFIICVQWFGVHMASCDSLKPGTEVVFTIAAGSPNQGA